MCHSSKSLMDEWKTDDMFAETLYLYSNFWKNNKNNNFQTLKHGEFAFMRSADSEVHAHIVCLKNGYFYGVFMY